MSGCSLQLGDRWVRLYAVHSATVADFLALKDVLQSMGQQGLKPCPCCSNIVKADIAEGSLTLLPVHSLETHRFVLRTDESMRVLQDSMRDQRAILTDTEFEKLESRMGYHYWPNSVLNAESLQYKAISTLMFDWPHVYVINGVAQYEIAAFMSLSRAITPQHQKAIITYEHLSEHVEHFYVA